MESHSAEPPGFFSNASQLPSAIAGLVGRVVVLDVTGPYAYLGTLVGGDAAVLTLREVDVHDLRDTSTTREEYVLTARKYGVNPNRKQAIVRTCEVISLSALDDVIA